MTAPVPEPDTHDPLTKVRIVQQVRPVHGEFVGRVGHIERKTQNGWLLFVDDSDGRRIHVHAREIEVLND